MTDSKNFTALNFRLAESVCDTPKNFTIKIIYDYGSFSIISDDSHDQPKRITLPNWLRQLEVLR